jgi:hypothetical protein
MRFQINKADRSNLPRFVLGRAPASIADLGGNHGLNSVQIGSALMQARSSSFGVWATKEFAFCLVSQSLEHLLRFPNLAIKALEPVFVVDSGVHCKTARYCLS